MSYVYDVHAVYSRILGELIMAIEVVSEDRYIELMNEELSKHELYRAGMEVVASPVGATGNDITGYSLRGGRFLPKVLADVAHIVSQSYDVKPNE